jgi:hypothetical protein
MTDRPEPALGNHIPAYSPDDYIVHDISFVPEAAAPFIASRDQKCSPRGKEMSTAADSPAVGYAVPQTGDATAVTSTVTGHLAGIDAEGRLLFRPEDSPDSVFPVAIGVEISDGVLVKAARKNRRALALRTGDMVPRWVLVGLVRERISSSARDARPGKLEVRVEGESVHLSADHDLTLSCGSASLTLRYDGKVVLSGTHVVSTSHGPNRIKGASVAIN